MYIVGVDIAKRSHEAIVINSDGDIIHNTAGRMPHCLCVVLSFPKSTK